MKSRKKKKLEENRYWCYSDSAFSSRVLLIATLKHRSSWYYSRDWSTLQLKDALTLYTDPLDFPKVTSGNPSVPFLRT